MPVAIPAADNLRIHLTTQITRNPLGIVPPPTLRPVGDSYVGQPAAATPKAVTSLPLHTTEIYDMAGDLLDSYETASRQTHVMVDDDAYATYLKTTFASLNPDDPSETTAFVDGLVTNLTAQEKQTGTDLIALEKGESLIFSGQAKDYTYTSPAMTRQYGEGQLNVMALFDNGKTAILDSFDAVSGPMHNGLIPNGKFRVAAPTNAVGQFPDESGKFGFKMVITPLERMARGDFRIHSVQSKAKRLCWMTEGCIGLSGGHTENVRFFGLMQNYFRNHKSIDLAVAIDGNANVKNELPEAADYK